MFMFRLLGRLKGVLILADCLIGLQGYYFLGDAKISWGTILGGGGTKFGRGVYAQHTTTSMLDVSTTSLQIGEPGLTC